MYEVLCGRPPFVGMSPLDTMQMHVQQDAKPFKQVNPRVEIPRELEHIVLKSLQRDVTKRYQHVQELWNDLKFFGEQVQRSQKSSTASGASAEPSKRDAVQKERSNMLDFSPPEGSKVNDGKETPAVKTADVPEGAAELDKVVDAAPARKTADEEKAFAPKVKPPSSADERAASVTKRIVDQSQSALPAAKADAAALKANVAKMQSTSTGNFDANKIAGEKTSSSSTLKPASDKDSKTIPPAVPGLRKFKDTLSNMPSATDEMRKLLGETEPPMPMPSEIIEEIRRRGAELAETPAKASVTGSDKEPHKKNNVKMIVLIVLALIILIIGIMALKG